MGRQADTNKEVLGLLVVIMLQGPSERHLVALHLNRHLRVAEAPQRQPHPDTAISMYTTSTAPRHCHIHVCMYIYMYICTHVYVCTHILSI
jgi:hypothetical protein